MREMAFVNHLIGSPLALADAEYAKKVWIKFQDLPGLQNPQIKFIQASVSSVDCEAKTAITIDSTTKVASTYEYDYFVAAYRSPESVACRASISDEEARQHGVVVVGGGAVGIECAAELKLVKPDVKVTLIHSRDKLLSSEHLSDECKDKALELLREAGVDVLMNHRLASTREVETANGPPKYELEFTNGHKIAASYVKIENNCTFSPGTPNAEFHLCAGDLTKWSGIKRCGWAMHSGHYAAQNIHKFVQKKHLGQEPKFAELQEVPPMIGLAVGKKAVASGPEGTVFGEDVMQAYFKHDLGFTICWDWMGLAGRKEDETD
ncbi:hypothetical protein J3459_014911 [Metarhizium acridum]|nr:hypothetical protein J3459_014911 [Metarhizium acridum]